MDVAWHVIYPRIDREGQLAGKLRRKKLRAEKESLVVVVLGIFLSIDSISSENWYSVALKPINTCRRCKQVSDPYICQERGGKWCGHATLNLLFQESIEDEASRDVSSPRFHGNLLPSFFLLATSRIRKYESSNGVCPKLVAMVRVAKSCSPILGFFDYGREKNLCTESHPFGEESGGGGGFGKLEKVW